MKVILIVISVISFYPLFGQDTLEIEERNEFDDIIWQSFVHMDGDIVDSYGKASIDSIFRTYNFEDSIYECQYFLTFSFELDSCGSIIKFKPIGTKDHYGEEIEEFQSEFINWFLNKSKPIPNYCLVENKKYFQFSGLLHIEISCEPSEILYWEGDARISSGTVFVHQTDQGPIYFSGYNNFCNDQ